MTLTAPTPRSVEPGTGPTAVRVASVPAGHVYVRHLDHPDRPLVTRLPDPIPVGGTPDRWWPPAMLDPAWLTVHADEFDLLHLHFGFDALAPRDLEAVVDTLRSLGKPLVYTVHDLRNPHHADPSAHDAALDVLVPAADAVITLTPGAADVIARRWRRDARVLPHPHVIDLERITPRRSGRRSGEFVVGVHAKSVRPSLRPLAVLKALLPLRSELDGLRIRFDVHRDVFDRDGRHHDAELVAEAGLAARAGRLDLRVHDYFTDDELWAYLGSLDLSVLPYRFGTHSGWLEACYDLGTTVLAPSCGFYAQQHPGPTYGHDESGLDVESLQWAVRTAFTERTVRQADPDDRRREREALAGAHDEIYRAVLS